MYALRYPARHCMHVARSRSAGAVLESLHLLCSQVKIICSAGSVPPTQNASLFANITLLDDNKAEGDPAGGMVWMVPAGNLGHTALVGHATAVLLAFCTVAIAYSAFRFRL